MKINANAIKIYCRATKFATKYNGKINYSISACFTHILRCSKMRSSIRSNLCLALKDLINRSLRNVENLGSHDEGGLVSLASIEKGRCESREHRSFLKLYNLI